MKWTDINLPTNDFTDTFLFEKSSYVNVAHIQVRPMVFSNMINISVIEIFVIESYDNSLQLINIHDYIRRV